MRTCSGCGAELVEGARFCVRCGLSIQPPHRRESPVRNLRDNQPVTVLAETTHEEWLIGQTVVGLYEIVSLLGQGGMGKIYKVHHKGWNVDLAVKTPRPEILKRPGAKENFIKEAETWVQLGSHPHIVSCYYVRTIDELPRVFIEYIDGGSLADHIQRRVLYAGDTNDALAAMLDVAIQFAWGLSYAHEQGLVHQDIKPANVMITADGTVKVTDFGLAKARSAKTNDNLIPEKTGLVSSSGGTQAYQSPEQAAKRGLTRGTDIWSWGVSILEMFCGELTWISGQAAPQVMEEYLESGPGNPAIPMMPEPVAQLLNRCFAEHPSARPSTMREVADTLLEIYQELTHRRYLRSEPSATEITADALNNRALSFLDLGKMSEAESAWKAALQMDPHHAEATYNRGITLWRSGKLTDDALVGQLEAVRMSHTRQWVDEYLLALIHLERGDAESALTLLGEARSFKPQDSEINEAVKKALFMKKDGALWNYPGHSGSVCSIAVSTDHRSFLSGGEDRILRLWDVSKGKVTGAFQGHTDRITSVSMSEDKRLGLSGSKDKTLRLWDLSTGQCVRVFSGHSGAVLSAHLSRDSSRVLSGSADQTMRLWDVRSGRCAGVFGEHRGIVSSVKFTRSGTAAVSSASDGTAKFWDVVNQRCLSTFREHTDSVESVDISFDDRMLLTGSRDRTLRLWDLGTAKCVHVFTGHGGSITSVSFSINGDYFCSGSSDRTVRLWSAGSRRCQRTIKTDSQINAVYLDRNSTFVFTASEDQKVAIHRLLPDQPFVAPLYLSSIRSQAAASEAGIQADQLLQASEAAMQAAHFDLALEKLKQVRSITGFERSPKVLSVWKKLTLCCRRTGLRALWHVRDFEGHTDHVTSVILSQNGRWLISSSSDKTIRLWEVQSGRCIFVFKGHSDGISSVSLSRDGRKLLSGSWDGTLRLWEVETGKCLRVFQTQKDPVFSVCLSDDALWALSGGQDSNLRLWEVATGRCLEVLHGHHGPVRSVAFSADASHAVSAGEDRTMRLWNLRTAECERVLTASTHSLFSVYLSFDGHLAIVGGADRQLHSWKVGTGRLLRTFTGHVDSVFSACLSLDRGWILSCGADRTLRIWDANSGFCAQILEEISGINSVCLSDDAFLAATGSTDGRVRIYELDWDLEAPPTQPWDHSANSYLKVFLAQQTPYRALLPPTGVPTRQNIRLALARGGDPSYNNEDFARLLSILRCAGYGYIRPENVRRKLKSLAVSRKLKTIEATPFRLKLGAAIFGLFMISLIAYFVGRSIENRRQTRLEALRHEAIDLLSQSRTLVEQGDLQEARHLLARVQAFQLNDLQSEIDSISSALLSAEKNIEAEKLLAEAEEALKNRNEALAGLRFQQLESMKILERYPPPGEKGKILETRMANFKAEFAKFSERSSRHTASSVDTNNPPTSDLAAGSHPDRTRPAQTPSAGVVPVPIIPVQEKDPAISKSKLAYFSGKWTAESNTSNVWCDGQCRAVIQTAASVTFDAKPSAGNAINGALILDRVGFINASCSLEPRLKCIFPESQMPDFHQRLYLKVSVHQLIGTDLMWSVNKFISCSDHCWSKPVLEVKPYISISDDNSFEMKISEKERLVFRRN